MSLQEKAVLSKLTITEWRDQVTDKIVTSEIAEKYGVRDKRDRYVKALLPPFALDMIRASVYRIRSYHRKMTLPWYDDSVRVLASDMFMEYQQRMFELRSRFEHAVDAFVEGYPNFIELSKTEKGVLFDASQYPDIGTVKSKFSMKLLLMPFPNTSDFRLNIDEAELAKVKEQADLAIKTALYGMSQHLIDKLKDAVIQASKPPLTELKFETLSNTLDLVDRMNISDDSRVTSAVSAVRGYIFGSATQINADSISKLAAVIVHMTNKGD